MFDIDSTKPATKEQRDLLFQKMKKADYEWDAEKKELRKIDARENLTLDGDLMEADCPLVEQKPAWSEENEDTIKFLISHFCVSHYNRSFQFTSNKLITHDELLEKIRNLRPQSTWKPSEEQMKALSSISVTGTISYAGQEQKLIDLYNDLRKLKEE